MKCRSDSFWFTDAGPLVDETVLPEREKMAMGQATASTEQADEVA